MIGMLLLSLSIQLILMRKRKVDKFLKSILFLGELIFIKEKMIFQELQILKQKKLFNILLYQIELRLIKIFFLRIHGIR